MNDPHAELAHVLATNALLNEELHHARLNKEMLEEDTRILASRILVLQNFVGKAQGTCIGVAMSDCHPDPDGALMRLAEEAQDILFPPQEEPA